MKIIAAACSAFLTVMASNAVHSGGINILNTDGTVDCSIASGPTFVPGHAKVATYEANGKRHLWVEMSWDNNNRLAWFHNNYDATFELDTVFYNYNSKAWAKSFSNTTFSNLPRWYIDTQSLDNPNEKVVSIGSSNADALQANKLYYYGGRLETDWHLSNNPDSLVKAIVQRGRTVDPLCGTGWKNCVFSCQQWFNNYSIIPFQSTPTSPNQLVAPGCRKFSYNINSGGSATNC